ncbi:MAG: hypothetical protein FWE30_08375, partial [Bacteroidales bacterium]|nr:hypothetical protein [Bacteroidales bacterium]
PEWLAAVPDRGDFGGPVSLKATQGNPPGADPRSATITFVAANGDKMRMTITQSAQEVYAVTYNLMDLTRSNPADAALQGETYSTVFTADAGYGLPTAITVTMGGVPLAEGVGYNYDSATGEFTVTDVTGDLEITATGTLQAITVTAVIMTVTPFGTLPSNTFTSTTDITQAELNILVTLNTGCHIVDWYTTDNPLGVEAVFPVTAATTLYARLDGDGSATSAPITIVTAAELEALSVRVNTASGTAGAGLYYKLIADINLSDYGQGSSFNDGKGWIPIGDNNARPFRGHFDGGGFKITELYINNTVHDNTGLFGNVTNGTIQNLGVETAAGGITGYRYVGGVAGQVNNATVNNCYSTGTVTGGSYIVGGIAGSVGFFAVVSNCYATCTVSGTYHVGGIAGMAMGGNVINCAAFNPSVGRIDGGTYPQYFGRVTGGMIPGMSTMDGCVAYSGMTATGGISFTGLNTQDQWDGTSVDASTSKATYVGMGWLFDDSLPTPGPWVWDEAGFPRLSFGPAANPF